MLAPCTPEGIYHLCDPDVPTESEFEASVVRALGCIYEGYRCVVFGGGFRYDQEISRPDLALVARDFSHWFIIEVELLSHSLERHVLPQVRAFQYGQMQADCAAALARELNINIGQAQTLVERVPYVVAVITNGNENTWRIALQAHGIQFVSLSVFRSADGNQAFEVSGKLEVVKESLGFGVYSATDRALRFARGIDLPEGLVQIETSRGAKGLWRVSRDDRFTWVAKEAGRPDMPDAAHIQLIRAVGGRISLRLPSSADAN